MQPHGDFPGGPGMKNQPCNAEDVDSIPVWATKIPHATGQLGLRPTTPESPCHRELVCQKKILHAAANT